MFYKPNSQYIYKHVLYIKQNIPNEKTLDYTGGCYEKITQ